MVPLPIVVAAVGVMGLLTLLSGVDSPPSAPPMLEQLEKQLEATALTHPSYGATKPEAAYQTFLRMEPTDVPDYVLLAVLLSGSTQRSPVDVAMEVIERAGHDLGQVANPAIYREAKGVGNAGRARMLAAVELARRVEYRKAVAEKRTVTTPRAAAEVLRTISIGPQEKLAAIYLDRRRRVIGSRLLSIGSDAFTIVDPRIVLRPALELGAQALILSHQHPSGDPTPSTQDHEVTRRVSKAGNYLGVALLDHIILGSEGRFTSLAERGELPSWTHHHSPLTSQSR